MLTTAPARKRPWLILALLSGTAVLSACGTVNNATQSSDSGAEQIQSPTLSAVNRHIAADIVQLTEQIIPAFDTTLQFSTNRNDALLQHFAESFANSGYGVQRVSADQGSHFFTYRLDEKSNTNGDPIVQFSASVGAMDISRDYNVQNTDSIAPASPVRLSGTRVPVEVDSSPIEGIVVSNDDHSRVVYVASLNLEQQAPPLISLISDDLVSRVATSNTGGLSNAASLRGLNSSRIETNNIFHTRESNFLSVLEGRESALQQFIVFGNDSLVLGNTNKLLIEQLINQKLQNNDVISLIGCSTGRTALDIGNEGLALGRAQRVVEALLSLGVARDRILDEGCWAPDANSTELPNRGVMLEIWRQNT